MQTDLRYRALVFLALLLLLLLMVLFFHLAREYGRSQVALEDLPGPVLRTLEQRLEPGAVFVQIDRLPGSAAYLVRLQLRDGRTDRVRITADGRTWPAR